MKKFSNFSGNMISKSEMIKVNGGKVDDGCMPAHWDVRIDGVHTGCYLTEAAAKKAAVMGGATEIAEWKYNPGNCA
jgi:hypothetical protein